MHITLQKSGRVLTKLAVERGPALIGSDPSVSIRLDSPTIPKRQAILLQNSRGYWFLEDLGSGGRTLLNGNSTQRAKLSAGDRIDIGQFRLIIGSDQDDSPLSPVRPTAKLPELPESAVVRYPEDAISVRTATAGNLQDLTSRLLLIDNQQQMLKEILDCLLAIFGSANAWIGLRTDMKAPIAISTGRSRTGRAVDESLLPPVLLERALEHDHAVLIPKVSDLSRRGLKIFRTGRAGSAMSCPVRTPKGTIGVLYVDNATGSTAYNGADLDQFILVAGYMGAAINHMVDEWSARNSKPDRLVGSAEQVGSLLKPAALPALAHCAIQAAAYPGRGEGLDCHDVRSVGESLLTVLLVNTTRHDAQSLVCLSGLRGAFAVWSETDQSPSEFLKRRNRNLLAHQDPCPTAATVARLHLDSGRLEIANAGGQPIYLLDKSGQLTTFGSEDVVPLGLDPGVTFTDHSLDIQPEQTLILWTKGIISARNAQRKQYGLERFTQSVEENFGRSAPDMVRDLWQDLRSFMGQIPQRNPITLLVIQPTLAD
ncbi:MAG: SpoIIE family protein phosphatase [Actinobacteria bacterium]|nr:SpoIIE family protein phosphatase [Actinomycetota bacterium]